MPFDIVNFRSAIQNNIIKPNKFMVQIFVPPGMNAEHLSTARDLELFGEMAEMPTMSYMTGEVMRYGYGATEKRPFAPSFREINIMFIADAQGRVLNFFNSWYNLVCSADLRAGVGTPSAESAGAVAYELSYKTDYVTDLRLMIYKDCIAPGTLVKQIYLRDAYPYGMGQAKLEWADNNSYLRFPVTFTYTDIFTE